MIKAVLVLAFLLCACGKKQEAPDETKSGSATTGSATATPPADAAVAVTPDAPPPDAAPPAESQYGYCEMQVTGGFEGSMRKALDKKSMGSDYWLSKSEAAAGKARVKAAEKREGIDLGEFQTPFELNCGEYPIVSVLLRGSLATKLKHIKLGPGEYPIDDDPKKPGSIETSLVVYKLGAMKPAKGTMKITRFEKSGEFEASWEMEAEPMGVPDKKVKVTGKVVYHCADYDRCGRGGR